MDYGPRFERGVKDAKNSGKTISEGYGEIR